MGRAEWKPRRLDELGFVGRGKSRHRPRNDARLFGGPYPFIQTAEIMDADPYITTFSRTYSEFGLKQSKMWPQNTLCITIAGANTARTAILKFDACFPDSVVGFVPDQAKADLHFVKYSLDLMRNRFLSVSRGATQDNLSLDKLLSFPIVAPEVGEQRRIGAILSAYDELIENNKRRINILEAIARDIYREWFVRFRSPGHGRPPCVPSPLGEIPQGYDAPVIGKLAKVVLGGTPARSVNEYWRAGTIPWLKSGKLNEIRVIEGTELITDYGLANSAAKLMPPKTVLVAITGAILVSFLEIEACANQSVIGIFDTHRICPEYLHIYLSENISVFESKMSGSAQQHINKEIVEQTPVLVPPKHIADAFRGVVQPIYDEIKCLLFKIKNLRATRDLLLPRLLSGQNEVEAA